MCMHSRKVQQESRFSTYVRYPVLMCVDTHINANKGLKSLSIKETYIVIEVAVQAQDVRMPQMRLDLHFSA